ncbi:hypothetical protein LEL_09893 [Akanthomyces lecanii RCEF 1005]|uniref:Histidinolphosphatase-like protein n=1 Tax=Akanthomyces lecanii RCEF 1005 TaxID=1081108 RepID=A0A168BGC6_CORDF|nr:hypothetical protein LEL_09893 [Akanthomyces lecanii RCEF 1005]
MAANTGPITLSLPSKYASAKPAATAAAAATTSSPPPPPPVDWLTGTWTVTHSTLSMWRSARNVRITYAPLAAKGDGRARIDDLVEYEPTSKQGVLKTVTGVDTRSSDAGGGWDWRGKGWLFFVSSHWEVLGWGETPDGAERWAVTWFAPTMFTKEGIDVYSSRREGISEGVYAEIDRALRGLGAKALVDMTTEDMQPVEIKLPWTEK